MTATYYEEAKALARKAIGWRHVALEAQRQVQKHEQERARSTWHSLERLDSIAWPDPEFRAALLPAFAALKDAAKACDEPMTSATAKELFQLWCRTFLTCSAQHTIIPIQWAISFDQPPENDWAMIENNLRQGGFSSLNHWYTFREKLPVKMSEGALLDFIFSRGGWRYETEDDLMRQSCIVEKLKKS